MSYRKNLEKMKDINLPDAGFYVLFDPDELDEETIARMEDEGYDGEGRIWVPDIDRLNIPYSAVQWEWKDDSDEALEKRLSGIIKPAAHYLVYAAGCRWTRADGYTLTDRLSDTVRRSGDAYIYPTDVSKGGKVLTCCESSHDVPLGSTTYIIALTGREYEKLSYWDADFSDVRRFVEKHTGK